MRVNIYAEEMTDRVEIVNKGRFTGLRFYLYLPVTQKDTYVSTESEYPPYHTKVAGGQIRGPFMHGENDDDSAAVTFWGKQDLRIVLRKALELLDKHYATKRQE